MPLPNIRKIERNEVFERRFSVCTLVTNLQEYQEMLASFVAAGFTEDICEYIYIDNSNQNTFEAYRGLNRFLREAKGKYVILCHQDILLHHHRLNDLEARIEEVNLLDPNWAVLANAGGINLKYTSMHLTQKSGNVLKEKYLPLKTENVDENFILVKNSANLMLSADLEGYHLYGTDLCLMADIAGYSACIIDFNLTHKSDGNPDGKFDLLEKQLIRKYRRALKSRFIGTTITRFYISGSRLRSILGNTGLVLFLARQYYKWFKPKKGYYKG